MDVIQKDFAERLQEHGIHVDQKQLDQFETYYETLVEWNEKMNLTGITERDQVYTKHFYDSVTLAFYVDMSQVGTLADIGSGAGFPGIPLKICFPHIKLTIVDSLNKRINFLKFVVDTLGLSDVELIHGRAEEVARKREYRDHFDLVTARAVARMALLNEFCLPFTKVGGQFAAMKGSNPAEEIEESKRSLKELRGRLDQVHSFSLPIEQSDRHIVVVDKVGSTPGKYPRKPGMAAKSPLV
ncbi:MULTISPECIES: 16S rRNA (guanine(527)-N(7))-methyltransferase RsmG [Paenibacillus]|uniref:Ribosomal RNA small subunit methyltransferase G n=1 Tax=Paenibacillus campinasensis TaxID=66347 RepID=A0A268ELS3_9BACL|nr:MULTISPECIES: 16S rRNA (guanine(527)-N(7))-methyltransferase RsmG [Paenibacillus]MUG68608.1 16S rRNA (guanine(527)-N(7))-methyltransferase RsmG [Paenibacillus campinasensis]PAD74065.1 16S rRNA (guanine(527)-N(7))-methyltransferase RsmG [Paenibacillus campinasensis]PAK50681.1 16S rRNA (guanine(527)-N(7))-methyltransferase RsmG [Paenibacillus sp. 7541]